MINENENENTVSEMSSVAEAPAPERTRKPRGFAAMDPKLVSELAKRGGKAAHRAGTAHQFTSEEARVAGRKGGEAVSRDRAHMAAIGRAGGQAPPL